MENASTIVSNRHESEAPRETHPAHPMHHHVEKVSVYINVFVALMVLLVATYIVALFDLDHVFRGLNLIVAMIIAVIKASLGRRDFLCT